MRKYIFVFLLLIAGAVNSFGQAYITPNSPAYISGVKYDEFVVSVDVSNVTDLFGVSFKLDYNTRYIDYVSASADPWFGNDLVFLAVPDEVQGTVSIGVSRKNPAGGISGSGSIVKIKFRLTQLPQIQNCELAFIMSQVSGTDRNGGTVSLNVHTGSTIVILPPEVPKLYSPAGGSIDVYTALSLYWAKALYASGYRIQISTDINFLTGIFTDTTVTDTLWYASYLLSGKTYYWRVMAMNTGGTSLWSEVWSFTTAKSRLRPAGPADLSPLLNKEFEIVVNVTNVYKLFGISFRLSYNTAYLDYVSSSADPWLGNDLVFVGVPDEAKGDVSIGISRKYPLNGVSGTGSVAHIKFRLVSLPQTKVSLNFILNGLKAVDKDGNEVGISLIDSSSTVVNGKTDTSPWTQVISGLSTLNVVSMAAYSNKIYAATSTGGVFFSTDNGDSWTYMNYNNSMSSLRVNRLYNSGGSSSSLYACTDGGLYLSNLGSSNWVNLMQNVSSSKQVTCFASSSASDAKLIIGTRGGGVFKSNSSGTSWTPISEGITNLYINDLLVFTNGTAEIIMAGTQDGVFISTNYGAIWKKKSLGLSGNALRITGFSYSGNSVLISTQNGLFRSTDLGESWSPVLADSYFYSISGSGALNAFPLWVIGPYVYFTNDLVTFNNVSTQGINSQCTSGAVNSQYVFMGTDGNGVYRKQKTLITSLDEENQGTTTPKDYMLLQNYPNPFNPSTKITYTIPESGQVKLRVYDMLGNEVGSLVNEYKSAGTYTVQFSASGLPSGMYVYRLETGKKSVAGKMMIVK